MGIFGSYANGLATDESDVDIVIERNVLTYIYWFISKKSLRNSSAGLLILFATELL
jgi:predicted nucleotidyltransferase